MAEGRVDPQQITLGGKVEEAPAPKFKQAVAVFVGVDLSWRARISDLGMNTEIAESWEDLFSSWDVDGRIVQLRSRPHRYRVSLRDGVAKFLLDGPASWDLAVDHVQTYLAHLHERGRGRVRVQATVQHLVPVEEEFDSLLEKLVGKLFNHAFYRSLGDPLDMAYVVDVVRDGINHQISIGALRGHEIQRKVSAQLIDHYPERSIFVEVTGHNATVEGVDFDAAEHLSGLREFGRSLAEGMIS